MPEKMWWLQASSRQRAMGAWKNPPSRVGRAAAAGCRGSFDLRGTQVQLAEEVLMLESREERSVLRGPVPDDLPLETSMAR